MQLRKLIASFAVLLTAWMVTSASYAQPQNDPVALLKYIADNMIRELKANKANLKNKPQIVYSLARRYVVPYANVSEMSRRVIPSSVWNSATSEQKSKFQKEFTTTLIRTYASALTAYNDQSIKFYPVRGGFQGKKSVTVQSEIVSSESSPITVRYRMSNSGGVWRLVDLSVEGVDMLQSFRAQFSDILSSGNMDELLRRMTSHTRKRE